MFQCLGSVRSVTPKHQVSHGKLDCKWLYNSSQPTRAKVKGLGKMQVRRTSIYSQESSNGRRSADRQNQYFVYEGRFLREEATAATKKQVFAKRVARKAFLGGC